MEPGGEDRREITRCREDGRVRGLAESSGLCEFLELRGILNAGKQFEKGLLETHSRQS